MKNPLDTWKKFADALDSFRGTGLGTCSYRTVVGKEPDGRPICRYDALGAAYRSLGHNGIDHAFHSIAIREAFPFTGIAVNEIQATNDGFEGTRKERLEFMCHYAHLRARGESHGQAKRLAFAEIERGRPLTTIVCSA